jgi:hypothetical protein
VVGHGIGKVKTWRSAADRDRNPLGRHTRMMNNVAGLHNRMFGQKAGAARGILRRRSRLLGTFSGRR